MRRLLVILAAALATAGTAQATTFYLSTEGGETLAGLGFTGGDVVRYEDSPPPGTATELFDELLFSGGGSEEVDAFELLTNGHMLLSTQSPASLPGISGNFGNGDVVDWDPVNLVASIFFNDALFTGGGSTDTDAVAVLSNGDLLLSTTGNQTLGGLSFRDGDVVRWNGTTATLFFDENWFGPDPNVNTDLDVDVDAFDVTDAGLFVLSHFETSDATLGGLTFRNGDLVLYDPGSGLATLLISEDVFNAGNTANIDAVAVPEPNALGLLALGLVGLAVVGRRR